MVLIRATRALWIAFGFQANVLDEVSSMPTWFVRRRLSLYHMAQALFSFILTTGVDCVSGHIVIFGRILFPIIISKFVGCAGDQRVFKWVLCFIATLFFCLPCYELPYELAMYCGMPVIRLYRHFMEWFVCGGTAAE